MRLIIAGTRTYAPTFEEIDRALRYAMRIEPIDLIAVLSGCADGADTVGAQWARAKGIPVQEYPANWREFGKRAGMIRNGEMAKVADALLAFWDGRSRGTSDMIDRMKQRPGRPVCVVGIR